jgi:hypothetical protein
MDCSYPFSRARIRALFRSIGVSSSPDDPDKPKTISWDERVVYLVEKTAREILSQRRIDELWQPQDDREGANPMDGIADAIKEGCSFRLRLRGVNLYACRIVNFEFQKIEERNEEDFDEVKQKQLTTWSADWQREADQTRAKGKAEADLLKQEARAYAYTNLLTAVAEGLQEARQLDPQLPHYVIAVKFVSALEKLIEEQPESTDIHEARASLRDVKKMIPWTRK